MNKCPQELLKLIASHLSTYDIWNIRQVSSRFRRAVLDTIFAKHYLKKEASQLAFHLKLETQVSSLDRFDIGINESGRVVLHHGKFTSSDVYTFEWNTVGRAFCSLSRFKPLRPCKYTQGVNASRTSSSFVRKLTHDSSSIFVPDSHRASCALCGTLKLVRIGYTVDKGYRVFFDNWQDSLDFELPHRVRLNIQISHAEVTSSWNAPTYAPPNITVYRYGLIQSEEEISRLERFWKPRKRSSLTPTSS